MTGIDVGPKRTTSDSNWNKKTISTSTNKMRINFKSDDIWMSKGFIANIYFIPISNKECESWLDMDKKVFTSPNYPQTQHHIIKCSWLITINYDYHITLDFIDLYVRYQICIKKEEYLIYRHMYLLFRKAHKGVILLERCRYLYFNNFIL